MSLRNFTSRRPGGELIGSTVRDASEETGPTPIRSSYPEAHRQPGAAAAGSAVLSAYSGPSSVDRGGFAPFREQVIAAARFAYEARARS